MDHVNPCYLSDSIIIHASCDNVLLVAWCYVFALKFNCSPDVFRNVLLFRSMFDLKTKVKDRLSCFRECVPSIIAAFDLKK